jgi:hypothetical protein
MRSSVLAAGVDPAISGAISGLFSDMQGLVLTVLAVAAFGLLLAIIAVKVGTKWLSRFANK